MAQENLADAKLAKKDEFYTQYSDIEKEIAAYLEYNKNIFKGKSILLPCDDPEWSNFTKYFAQNFERFGLKKLISTSFAVESKKFKSEYQPTPFEKNSQRFSSKKTRINGKIFTLSKDNSGDGKVDVNDLEWDYLKGDGDFRSEEISKLKEQCDIIITNPPFSLFREFLAWINKSKKQFVIVGSLNVITYKEVFPLLKNDKMWLGNGFQCGNAFFSSPFAKEYKDGIYISETGLVKFRNVCWFSNIDHGRRHQPLQLMTTKDNLKFNKKLQRKLKYNKYDKYDNYDAIEVPFTDAIPSDYKGVMGVPISFLDKYSPEQFEILGLTQRGCHDDVPDTRKYDDYLEVKPNGQKTGSTGGKTNENANLLGNDGEKHYFINKQGRIVQSSYQRIFIRHRK